MVYHSSPLLELKLDPNARAGFICNSFFLSLKATFFHLCNVYCKSSLFSCNAEIWPKWGVPQQFRPSYQENFDSSRYRSLQRTLCPSWRLLLFCRVRLCIVSKMRHPARIQQLQRVSDQSRTASNFHPIPEFAFFGCNRLDEFHPFVINERGEWAPDQCAMSAKWLKLLKCHDARLFLVYYSCW